MELFVKPEVDLKEFCKNFTEYSDRYELTSSLPDEFLIIYKSNRSVYHNGYSCYVSELLQQGILDVR